MDHFSSLMEFPKSFQFRIPKPMKPIPPDRRLTFKLQNFIDTSPVSETYDTVVCLSTTVYIHFMFGDIGIYRLFQKIALSLKPKGHLILEPHTWKSYKKKKYFSNYYTSQYKKITFRPNLFNLYLLESLSLKLVETISPMESIEGQTRKIIYIFQKI